MDGEKGLVCVRERERFMKNWFLENRPGTDSVKIFSMESYATLGDALIG